MKSIISEGRTSNEAIEKGLKELGCKKNEVDIKILENEDKRSFYSILDPRVVKVEITVKEEKRSAFSEKSLDMLSDEQFESSKIQLEKFLNEFLKLIGDANFKIEKNNDFVNVYIDGKDSSKLIGFKGEVINSLQNILNVIASKNQNCRIKVFLDVSGYKKKREDELKCVARKFEKVVAKNGKKVILEPMNAYERKIIHTELQDSSLVKTYSIGEEPNRKVVIEKI
mgnify:FL=1